MTLPFALRTRIDFREPPRQKRAIRMPNVAGPIVTYWGVMGLLAYGVSSGALPLDEWFWPVEKEPVVESAPPAPPPARVTPFPDVPASAASPELEAAPSAPEETAPAAPAPLPQFDEDVPVARAPAGEPRRITLSLSYTPQANVARAPEPAAPAEPTPAPARAAVTERAPAERVAAAQGHTRAPLPEPTSHLAWSMPVWGAADSQRGKLTSPDAARGRRHAEPTSDDYLFPDAPASGGSNRPARAPVAAVAPRFDSSREDAPRDDSPRESERPRPAAAVGSCEAAAASASDEVDLTKRDRGAPDITRDAYANVLNNGRYLSACRIPSSLRFDICTAVRDGRAVGVTVTTSPKNAGVAACVRSAVSRLSFPISPRLDVTRTRFEPAR